MKKNENSIPTYSSGVINITTGHTIMSPENVDEDMSGVPGPTQSFFYICWPTQFAIQRSSTFGHRFIDSILKGKLILHLITFYLFT